MRQLIINVQENKYPFFLELLENMDFIDIQDDFKILEEHKKIVRGRMKKIEENPERLLDWDKVKYQIKFETPINV